MSEHQNLSGKVVTVLTAIAGLIILIYSAFEYSSASQSSNWQTTVGRVYHSELEARRSQDSDSSFEANIRYIYEVKNRTYESSRVYFGSSFQQTSSKLPNSLLEQYPKNSNPTVYFDPNNPKEAVLVPGVNNNVLWLIFIGIGMLLGGAYGTFSILQEEK